jgi:hypothetical protein
MHSLRTAIYLNATLAFVAAIASVVRGKKYVYGLEPEIENNTLSEQTRNEKA